MDVARAVADRAGISVRFVAYENFADAADALSRGDVDVLPDFGAGGGRLDQFIFTRPFEAFRICVFVRRSDPGIDSLTHLAGRRVGVVRTNLAVDLLGSTVPEARLQLYDDPREALFELLSASVDAVAYPEEVFLELARSAGVESRIRPLPTALAEVPRAMAVRPEDQDLRARLDRGVQELIESDEYGEIYGRWFGAPPGYWNARHILVVAIGLVLFVLVAMATWRYQSVKRLAVQLQRSTRERDAAQEARMREAERFRQIAEHIHEVFWMTSSDKNVLEYVSPAYEKIWGLPVEPLYRDSALWLESVHPEDRDAVAEALPLQAEGGYDIEYRIVRPDGEIRWIWDRAFPVRDENGRVGRVVGVARDVTDRVTTEHALAARERRFRAFVENAGDLISTLDRNGRMGYQSAPLERLLGYRPEELEGEEVFGYIHPEDGPEIIRLWKDVVARPGGSTQTGPFRFRHRDGTWRTWVATLTNLLDDPAVEAILSNGRDITEREELERQLRQSQKLEAVGRLAGGIAHDFNNLLTVIRSQTDLILLDADTPQTLIPDLELIRDSSNRAADLTRQLLAFSRDQILRPRTADVGVIVRDVAKLVRRIIGEDITTVLELPEDVPAVHVDPAQLEQVVLNLCVNARDAMPDGGTLTLRTFSETLDAEAAAVMGGLAPGRYSALQVSDTGVGMDERTQRRIFEPFFTTKPTGQGTGLGLAMAYGFVAQTGGHIDLESAPGRGTTFTLRFPSVEGHPENTPAWQEREGAGDMVSGTVLIIEDDPSVRRVARKLLERIGVEVQTYESGEAGLDALEGGAQVDLVLTDLVLPGVGGRQVLARIRERWPDLPVVVMSGYADGSPGRAEDLAADVPFVQKPFSIDDLLGVVRNVLRRE